LTHLLTYVDDGIDQRAARRCAYNICGARAPYVDPLYTLSVTRVPTSATDAAKPENQTKVADVRGPVFTRAYPLLS